MQNEKIDSDHHCVGWERIMYATSPPWGFRLMFREPSGRISSYRLPLREGQELKVPVEKGGFPDPDTRDAAAEAAWRDRLAEELRKEEGRC